jgi:anthranilate synthase/aminodeoxychorismate synthase-like glutamine amidotransferase
VISPGPCTPAEAGVSVEVCRRARKPLLGVCLGHQSLVQQFGGEIVRADRLMHGKTSLIRHDGRTIFEGLPQPFEVGRYHSLCAAPGTLPDTLEVSAETERGEIMGVRHKRLPLEGVQFHPESVLTPEGGRLMANFLRMKAT